MLHLFVFEIFAPLTQFLALHQRVDVHCAPSLMIVSVSWSQHWVFSISRHMVPAGFALQHTASVGIGEPPTRSSGVADGDAKS